MASASKKTTYSSSFLSNTYLTYFILYKTIALVLAVIVELSNKYQSSVNLSLIS
jgi:hypothetical protein